MKNTYVRITRIQFKGRQCISQQLRAWANRTDHQHKESSYKYKTAPHHPKSTLPPKPSPVSSSPSHKPASAPPLPSSAFNSVLPCASTGVLSSHAPAQPRPRAARPHLTTPTRATPPELGGAGFAPRPSGPAVGSRRRSVGERPLERISRGGAGVSAREHGGPDDRGGGGGGHGSCRGGGGGRHGCGDRRGSGADAATGNGGGSGLALGRAWRLMALKSQGGALGSGVGPQWTPWPSLRDSLSSKMGASDGSSGY